MRDSESCLPPPIPDNEGPGGSLEEAFLALMRAEEILDSYARVQGDDPVYRTRHPDLHAAFHHILAAQAILGEGIRWRGLPPPTDMFDDIAIRSALRGRRQRKRRSRGLW